MTFVLQVLYAVGVRLVSPVVGIPILLYDLLLAAVAIGDYLVSQRGAAPLALQAAVSARDVIVGMGVGRAALLSPLTMLVPMLAPAYPARWRISGAVRAVLVLAATALTTLLAMEWPRGVAAVRSYDVAMAEPMQARPRGDFLIGVRFLPVLDGVPLARTVRADTMLFAAFAPDVVLLVLDDEGTTPTALDSLAGSWHPGAWTARAAIRCDWPSGCTSADGHRWPVSAARVRAVGRVLERLRPDVIFPHSPIPCRRGWAHHPPSHGGRPRSGKRPAKSVGSGPARRWGGVPRDSMPPTVPSTRGPPRPVLR